MRNQGQLTPAKSSKSLDDGSMDTGSEMVNIASPSTTNAKITFSTFDKSKEEYMRQFSEKVNILPQYLVFSKLISFFPY